MTSQDVHDLVLAVIALLGALTGLANFWLHWLASGRQAKMGNRVTELETTVNGTGKEAAS